MAQAPIPLSSLIADGREAVDTIVAEGAADRPDLAAVQKAAGALGDAVESGVRDACQADLVELLVQGWAKASELKGYGDKVKYPPPTTTRMVLGKHVMKIAIDPELTIVAGGALRFPLQFIVEFVATISAARLTIVDGAIDAVDLGSLALAAKLRWKTAEVPLPLKSREIPFPGHFDIKPRFAIPFSAPA